MGSDDAMDRLERIGMELNGMEIDVPRGVKSGRGVHFLDVKNYFAWQPQCAAV